MCLRGGGYVMIFFFYIYIYIYIYVCVCVCVCVCVITGPRPPIGVTVKKLADDKVKVTWSPSGQNGKIGYLVSYSEVDANDQPAGELRTEPVFGTSSSFVIDGLRSDLRYRFRVSALSRYGEGIPSSPVFLGEKRTGKFIDSNREILTIFKSSNRSYLTAIK